VSPIVDLISAPVHAMIAQNGVDLHTSMVVDTESTEESIEADECGCTFPAGWCSGSEPNRCSLDCSTSDGECSGSLNPLFSSESELEENLMDKIFDAFDLDEDVGSITLTATNISLGVQVAYQITEFAHVEGSELSIPDGEELQQNLQEALVSVYGNDPTMTAVTVDDPNTGVVNTEVEWYVTVLHDIDSSIDALSAQLNDPASLAQPLGIEPGLVTVDVGDSSILPKTMTEEAAVAAGLTPMDQTSWDQFRATPPAPPSSLAGPGLQGTAAGAVATFTLDLRGSSPDWSRGPEPSQWLENVTVVFKDLVGNELFTCDMLTGSQPDSSVDTMRGWIVYGPAMDPPQGNGTYYVSYYIETVGVYTATLKVNGVEPTASWATLPLLPVRPGPNNLPRVSGFQATEATAALSETNLTQTLAIQLQDQFGNIRSGPDAEDGVTVAATLRDLHTRQLVEQAAEQTSDTDAVWIGGLASFGAGYLELQIDVAAPGMFTLHIDLSWADNSQAPVNWTTAYLVRECTPNPVDGSCILCSNGTFWSACTGVCQLCADGTSDADNDPATPCLQCSAGDVYIDAEYLDRGDGVRVLDGPSTCAPCAPGRADVDRNSMTPCTGCTAGEYAAAGAASCTRCEDANQADHDEDPTTPCVSPADAIVAVEVELTLDIDATYILSYEQARVEFEDAFKADVAVLLGIDPSRVQISDIRSGSAVVTFQVLPDENGASLRAPEVQNAFESSPGVQIAGASITHMAAPTSSVVAMDDCWQLCPVGFEDADCDVNTPCTRCRPGSYSPGGTFTEETKCEACAPGTYAPQLSLVADCVGCPQGTADADLNSWTECIECVSGKIAVKESSGLPEPTELGLLALSNASRCYECPAGQFFDTLPAGGIDCTNCQIGRYNPTSGSISEDDCQMCAAGSWSFVNGSAWCDPCPVNSFRRSRDYGCQPCSDEAYKCDDPGLVVPTAAAGHYIAMESMSNVPPQYLDPGLDALRRFYYKCSPFVACVGTCTARELDDEQPDFGQCRGGIGSMSCSTGYTGLRCASCVAYDSTRGDEECVDANPNGYYRLNDLCEPCPCSWLTPTILILIAGLILVIVMVAVDYILRDTDHASAIFAPVMICVSFFQTLGLLLDLDIEWPPQLRELLSAFNALNINIELARPECSGKFGAKEKLLFTLTLPFFTLACLGVYALVKYLMGRGVDPELYKRLHGGTLLVVLIGRILTATTAAFMLGSIFFLRRVLMTWVCTPPEIPGGPTYLVVEPDIECSDTDEQYSALHAWAYLGLVVYISAFAAFSIGLWYKRDLFEFLVRTLSCSHSIMRAFHVFRLFLFVNRATSMKAHSSIGSWFSCFARS
jgi:hypothetical protein